MEIKEVRCIVSGKVQGVFYRDFIAKHARRLGLAGYAKNVPDSRVEIVAQGNRDKLEELIEHARTGPFLAKVSNVDVEWREPEQPFHSFEII